MLAIVSRFWPFGSNDNQTFGNAGEVFAAISERSELSPKHVGVLGEPGVVDRGGEFTHDPYVVVPLQNDDPSGPSPANLEYPLPDGVEDAGAEFYTLLDQYGIEDLSNLGSLEGKNVPLEIIRGSLVPIWEEMQKPVSVRDE